MTELWTIISSTSLTFLLVLAALWFARKLIASFISNIIGHKYDKKLEEFKLKIKHNDENISFIRNTVKPFITPNHNALTANRLRSIENLWCSFVEIQQWSSWPIKLLESMDNSQIRRQSDNITKSIDINNIKEKSFYAVKQLEPWLSYKVWALYSAYDSIVLYAIAKILTTASGLEPKILLKDERIIELINAIFPEHQIESINNSSIPVYLKDLELRLVSELKNEIKNIESIREEDVNKQ